MRKVATVAVAAVLVAGGCGSGPEAEPICVNADSAQQVPSAWCESGAPSGVRAVWFWPQEDSPVTVDGDDDFDFDTHKKKSSSVKGTYIKPASSGRRR